MKLTDEQRSMVEENIRLVYDRLNKAGYVGNRQDAEQECMLALCVAACNYDASRSKFSTYAVSCIDAKIRTLKAKGDLWSPTRQFKKEADGKVKNTYVGFKAISLNQKIEGNDEEVELMDIIPSAEEPLEDKVIRGLDFQSVLSKLSEMDRRILQLRMDGYTYNKIAEIIGISQPHACRRVKKILEKLNR